MMKTSLLTVSRIAVVVTMVGLSGIAMHFEHAAAQYTTVIDHRVIIGSASNSGYCYDWRTSLNQYGPGCWHNDEGAQTQYEGLDISGAGVVAGTAVYHQEYGSEGSINNVVTAINRCGPFDSGVNCAGGSGCSSVYVQMRDPTSSAILGEEHYLHIVPSASIAIGQQWTAGSGVFTVAYLGYLALTQPRFTCAFDGVHLHQSGDIRSDVFSGRVQYANFSIATSPGIGVPPGDPGNNCGGSIAGFLCVSPTSDYQYHWAHRIKAVPVNTPPGPLSARDIPVRSDFDGDCKTALLACRSDPAVWRPTTGIWSTLRSSAGFSSAFNFSNTSWGQNGDTPLSGDYDGDGRTDLAVWKPGTGQWWFLLSKAFYGLTGPTVPGYAQAWQWGQAGDIPLLGDYDGDRRVDLAIFRPSTGQWLVLVSGGYYQVYYSWQWGSPGDVPVMADYDGDGKADPTVWRPATGQWWVLKSSLNYAFGPPLMSGWGVPGDIPLTGDYDGDGKAEITIYRPGNGQWWVLKSSTGYAQGVIWQWGQVGDTSIPAVDVDGDRLGDPTVWRPNAGSATFWVLLSSTGFASWNTYQVGTSTDIPVR